jgi:hypothetical protein
MVGPDPLLLLLLWRLPLSALALHSGTVGKLAQVHRDKLVRLLPALAVCLAAVHSCHGCRILGAAGTVHLPQHRQHAHVNA